MYEVYSLLIVSLLYWSSAPEVLVIKIDLSMYPSLQFFSHLSKFFFVSRLQAISLHILGIAHCFRFLVAIFYYYFFDLIADKSSIFASLAATSISSTIICQSLSSRVTTIAAYVEFLAVCGLPLFSSSSVDSLPSTNCDAHTEMLLRSKISLPQTSFNALCISVVFLPCKV